MFIKKYLFHSYSEYRSEAEIDADRQRAAALIASDASDEEIVNFLHSVEAVEKPRKEWWKSIREQISGDGPEIGIMTPWGAVMSVRGSLEKAEALGVKIHRVDHSAATGYIGGGAIWPSDEDD